MIHGFTKHRSSSSYSSVVLGDGASHLWMLNESAGTTATDLGASPVNGTYEGTYTLAQSTGLTGIKTALSLSGAGYVLTGSAAFLASASTTVEGWVNQGSTSTGNLLAINNNAGIRLQIGSNAVNVIFNGAQIATASIAANAWYHVACTLQSSGIALFINGAQVTTGGGWTAAATAYAAYMGQSGVGSEYLTGKIAAVAIYPSILTATQIMNHYNAGK